jgi:integrase
MGKLNGTTRNLPLLIERNLPNMGYLRKWLKEKQHLAIKTIKAYKSYIVTIDEWVGHKDFKDLTEEDMTEINHKLYNGIGWGWHCKVTAINKFKAFSRWLLELDSSDPLPRRYKKLQRPNFKDKPQRCTPDNVLTSEQVLEMIKKATNPRDKWIIAGLFDTSFRPSEFQSITNKHLRKESDGAYSVYCPESKTYSRWCKLTFSDSYLKEWLRFNPFKDEDEFTLLPQMDGPTNKPISSSYMAIIVAKLGKKVGKKITSYHLRHAGITETAKILSGEELCRYAGWMQGSKMAATYVHMSSEDVGNKRTSAIMNAEIPKPKPNEIMVKQKICLSCETKHPSDAVMCMKCAIPLSIQDKINNNVEQDRLNVLANTLKDNPQFIVSLEKVMEQLKS